MTSNLLKIGFIGGGKMARALAKGFISAGVSKPENIISSCHPSDSNSTKVFKEMGCESTYDNALVVKKSDILVIAVKPNIVPIALGDIRRASDLKTDKLFVSLAMGVTLKKLQEYLPTNSRVMRVMPNTPVLVKSGTSVYVKGSKSTQTDVEITKMLMSSVGMCEEVTENLLDVVTALSGAGPAYVYVLIESLADGGVRMGLSREMAYRLAAQTVLGAAKMVLDTKLHPGILKDDVTSPAGSTAAGLYHLEQKGFRGAIIGAIDAATQQCKDVSSKNH